ncbi:MAG: tRNA 2-thiouridine(34) synthase MnmA [Mycoplasma sp.]|nr:tRNA 2-thiouridine(34) synthase MnmA [Mycoplasma sp.]
MKNKIVVLGMSGGVDSSVCAHILKEQGYHVIGLFMRNWDSIANNDILGNNNVGKNCPEEDDWKDVKDVSKQLEIEVHRVDFVEKYWENVFTYFIEEYKKGRTPNPDILCNKFIKFDAFSKIAFEKFNADYIAMGHYANTKDGILYRAIDQNKDQTYFLSGLSSKQIEKVLFPLGNLTKPEIRKIANDLKLKVANKKDSTGICFIGERNFTKFLQNYIPAQPGDVIDISTGEKVGTHIGVMYYTIGQRKGLNLGGNKVAYYVAGNDLEKKIIYVAPKNDKDYIIAVEARIKDINWISKYDENKGITAKFRYRQTDENIDIELNENKKNAIVKFKQGIEAVTPGQQAVFYQGDVCLGGGIIDSVKNLK